MSIGQNIKRLRRNADMTQEELAEILSISPQAVSRWETDAALPDISMLPAIVNLFGITSDELLGIDSAHIEEQVSDYKSRISYLYNEHRYGDMASLAREAVKTFPNDLRLIGELAFALTCGENELDESNIEEAIKHYKTILAKSADNTMRFRAAAALCRIFAEKKGDKGQALYYAKQLPKGCIQTSSYVINRYGLMNDSTKETTYRTSIETYTNALTETIFLLADPNYTNPESTLSAEQKIALLEKEIKIIHIVFGDDLLSENRELYEINRIIGCLWLLIGNNDKAIDSFEKAYRHAAAFEEYIDCSEYSSLLMSGVECDSHNLWSESAIHDFAQRIKTQQRYDVIRDDQRFSAIVNAMEARERMPVSDQ